MIAKRVIDWDAIEEAVADYGIYRQDEAYGSTSKADDKDYNFDATMVKIHNIIRKGTQ